MWQYCNNLTFTPICMTKLKFWNNHFKIESWIWKLLFQFEIKKSLLYFWKLVIESKLLIWIWKLMFEFWKCCFISEIFYLNLGNCYLILETMFWEVLFLETWTLWHLNSLSKDYTHILTFFEVFNLGLMFLFGNANLGH